MTNSFRLAPMSPLILAITLVLLALPVIFIGLALSGARFHLVPGLCVLVLYIWIWLRFRPSRFVVHDRSLEVIWPLKRWAIPRTDIARVKLIDRNELRREIGWGMRVGAGGLWGGFGWLWTKNRGIVQMYVSRTDGFVWIERKNGRPWLVTPDRPVEFVQSLSV
jgi:hypothetical protein